MKSMNRSKTIASATGALMLLATYTAAQQVSDESFEFHNPRPAFATGLGPRVCIDEGHYNFHTADGRYKPFANLLRGDGYVVVGYAGDLAPHALAGCSVAVRCRDR